MDVTVNQETYLLPDVCSIEQALTQNLKLPLTGIAVAINQEIIAKETWGSHFLRSGDHLTVIKATQGG
ncbi:MAG: sulfur carrier protein ThiS [Pedobacter sp.]|nr:MAG: sulfur carrier protein ThiS [Pedobacter sp.]